MRGLAYRLLGSLADADDVVQDAWIKWQLADRASVASPQAWLTTVTTRLALDRARSAPSRREHYPGPWLPEPVVTAPSPDPAELSESLALGFLVLLEDLSPLQRAVFVLADVFEVPFAEIAGMVGRTDAACRQMASRARRRVSGRLPVRTGPLSERRRALDGLVAALGVGDVDSVIGQLAPDVVLVSDGGPTRRAARRPVVGDKRVARLLLNLSRRQGPDQIALEDVVVNGEPGLLIRLGGRLDQVMVVEADRGRVKVIRLVRNPDKLTGVGIPAELL